jgi:hypothetical protein
MSPHGLRKPWRTYKSCRPRDPPSLSVGTMNVGGPLRAIWTRPSGGLVWTALSLAAVLPVSVTPKLGVSGTETEHMPFYLRTFVRLLSSWVHAYQRKHIVVMYGGRKTCMGFASRRDQARGAQSLEGCSPLESLELSWAFRVFEGCIRPSSQEPKSSVRLWIAASRCADVIPTSSGGNKRIGPDRGRPPRRREAPVHSAIS